MRTTPYTSGTTTQDALPQRLHQSVRRGDFQDHPSPFGPLRPPAARASANGTPRCCVSLGPDARDLVVVQIRRRLVPPSPSPVLPHPPQPSPLLSSNTPRYFFCSCFWISIQKKQAESTTQRESSPFSISGRRRSKRRSRPRGSLSLSLAHLARRLPPATHGTIESSWAWIVISPVLQNHKRRRGRQETLIL
jgi:hypothetical protein